MLRRDSLLYHERGGREVLMNKQIDIFGGMTDTQELARRETEQRKRYKTMQAQFGVNEAYTCKTCKHCEVHHYHSRNYYKCALWFQSHSSATDIRVNGTACKKYEEATNEQAD